MNRHIEITTIWYSTGEDIFFNKPYISYVSALLQKLVLSVIINIVLWLYTAIEHKYLEQTFMVKIEFLHIKLTNNLNKSSVRLFLGDLYNDFASPFLKKNKLKNLKKLHFDYLEKNTSHML